MKTWFAVLLALALLLLPRASFAWVGDPDWEKIQEDASRIHRQAVTLENEAFQMRLMAQQARDMETDPDVIRDLDGIIAAAMDIEQDAASIAVTADDINYRIDHSEATTLSLADDIGEMADRIGEMADRILWTEGQIGIMSDRIVVSEFLVSDNTLALVGSIQEINDSMTVNTQAIQWYDRDIQQQLAFSRHPAGGFWCRTGSRPMLQRGRP